MRQSLFLAARASTNFTHLLVPLDDEDRLARLDSPENQEPIAAIDFCW